MCALAKRPQERPADAAELIALLATAMGSPSEDPGTPLIVSRGARSATSEMAPVVHEDVSPHLRPAKRFSGASRRRILGVVVAIAALLTFVFGALAVVPRPHVATLPVRAELGYLVARQLLVLAQAEANETRVAPKIPRTRPQPLLRRVPRC